MSDPIRVGDLLRHSPGQEAIQITAIRTVAYQWVPLRRAVWRWMRYGVFTRWSPIQEMHVRRGIEW